jgi:hypothetical protein
MMVQTISKKTIFECTEEFKEYGYFMADEEIKINDVIPGAVFIGKVKDVIGYEPENKQLKNVYLDKNEIYLSAEGGNGWTFYGETEPEFAEQILSILSIQVN